MLLNRVLAKLRASTAKGIINSTTKRRRLIKHLRGLRLSDARSVVGRMTRLR